MKSLIKLENVSKRFSSKAGQLDVLKNVNLDIAKGDCVAIVGQSGSGKSTLLSIIGLLDSASEGEYLLSDTSVTSLSNYQLSTLRNRNIGWIFQNFNLVAELSVLHNVILPLKYNKSVKKADRVKLAMAQLALVGLADKAAFYPDQLSGGQQQRVAIARALISNPDVLLCDEPTGNLDSAMSDQIMDLLMKLHHLGTTLLVVTHDSGVAQRCQRTIRIRDGAVEH